MACNLQQHPQQQCVKQQQYKNHQNFSLRRIGRRHTSGFLTVGKLLHRGVAYALLLQLLVLVTQPNLSKSEGNVGCHFVKTLCLEESEVCFNDNIFGKCIPTTGVDVEDIEKTPLSLEQSRLLATLLEELQGAGLGWENPYVQCRIRSMLYSLRKDTLLPPYLCANFAPSSSNFGPPASLSFAPILAPYDDYTDELYYPPPKKQMTDNDKTNSILHDLQQERHLRHDPMELAHFGKLDTQSNSPNIMDIFLEEQARIQQNENQRNAELANERKETLRNQFQLYQLLAASEPDPQPYQRNTPSPIETLEKVMDQESYIPIYLPDVVDDSNEFYFPENYGPLKRNKGASKPRQKSFFRELTNEKNLGVDIPQPNINMFIKEEQQRNKFQNGLLRNSLTPFEEEAVLAADSFPHKRKHMQQDRVYTEGGGLIFLSPENPSSLKENVQEDNDDATTEQLRKEKARELLANMFGFTRHERLDVKKPGPLVGPPPLTGTGLQETNMKIKNTSTIASKEVMPEHINANKEEIHKNKKVVKDHSDVDHAPHSVDTEYTHVFVKNPIDNWSDGVRIMNELANILHMQGYFAYLTVQPREVSFRVDSNNPERKTAHDIARVINENRGVKNNILRRLGVTVLSADVGDKVKNTADTGVSSARIELAEQTPDVTHIMAYMFAGAGAAAVIVIFVTLILIKRHDKRRDKLGGLQTGIAGAESCSKDYQDLCRARMAGKGTAVEPVASGRITSLSKETDRPSSSSRSSTSSWSEEPALTNMDISTGHMVLSYMEDHLRNKGRLQREWEALCRYEAEPSARDAALQPQCAHLNRTGAPLPYDHSRVVLNHLANAEGLDYINASTITDHDPRAPAYIAAQGPTPLTLTHFWQLIWEQGAVVVVALCRLQENGEIACARYWPEEGAEVYHIYEVHLVSEHIWCDDYLVRSFYLKNLRTSETRTVTQFHFLSWPQNGVPVQAKPLLDFRRKVNKSYRSRSCPIVVHGSGGAGRTGAYLLLDMVLGRMNKGAREIDIAATLEHLRDQRAGLVATRQQFEFVLMAVAEEVHAILKALPANPANEKRDLDAKDATNTEVLKEEESEEVPTTSKKSLDNQEAQSSRTVKENENEKAQSGKGEDKLKSTPTKGINTNTKKK